MARKSRKETAAVAVQEADSPCRAAIYVRLSVEDTRAVPKEPARYALRNYKPLHLCMYQLPYPAADNARF